MRGALDAIAGILTAGRWDALALDWAALHYHHTAVAWIVYTLTGVVACGRLLMVAANCRCCAPFELIGAVPA